MSEYSERLAASKASPAEKVVRSTTNQLGFIYIHDEQRNTSSAKQIGSPLDRVREADGRSK